MNGFVFPFPRARVRGIKFILGLNTTEVKPLYEGDPFTWTYFLKLLYPLRLCLRCMKRDGLRQTTQGALIANKKSLLHLRSKS